MISAIQQELPNTHYIHCIYQNLLRKLKGVLGKDYLKFVSEFYKARNSLSKEMFEVTWNNLKNTYCQAENYLQNILYKFTSVFCEVNTLLNEWLSSSLCAEHQKQICEASTYYAKLIGNNDIYELLHCQEELDLENQINPELINNEDESTIAIFIKDKYEDKKIFFKNLLQEFNIDDIYEIWKVKSLLACSSTFYQYVVILKNGWHTCTYLLLTNSEVICRYYFKVMIESNFVKFHINMIPKRWYKEHLQSDLMKINNLPVVTLGNNERNNVYNVNNSERNQLIDIDFTQINIFN
ncbi:hypothetical protein C1646_671052 [Rhizophagus diaphanus]|nr:hypothetical protein C1646_671052 [Rhizophagus diaphanus] [Rhizophagus sp. MUCL 43196]